VTSFPSSSQHISDNFRSLPSRLRSSIQCEITRYLLKYAIYLNRIFPKCVHILVDSSTNRIEGADFHLIFCFMTRSNLVVTEVSDDGEALTKDVVLKTSVNFIRNIVLLIDL